MISNTTIYVKANYDEMIHELTFFFKQHGTNLLICSSLLLLQMDPFRKITVCDELYLLHILLSHFLFLYPCCVVSYLVAVLVWQRLYMRKVAILFFNSSVHEMVIIVCGTNVRNIRAWLETKRNVRVWLET
jgi:hypothetical protein